VKWWRAWWRARPPHSLRTLRIPATVEELMRDEAERSRPNETGGVLVGFEKDSGDLVVTAAVGPGPNALHSRSRFRRDGDYSQTEVDRLHHVTSGRDDYIGEWHSHPESGGPSAMDYRSMSWIGANASYARPAPVLVIMERTRRNEWRPRAFRWENGLLAELEVTTEETPPEC
jgi:integrative and conjugative element protein (TIGR02256 family)